MRYSDHLRYWGDNSHHVDLPSNQLLLQLGLVHGGTPKDHVEFSIRLLNIRVVPRSRLLVSWL